MPMANRVKIIVMKLKILIILSTVLFHYSCSKDDETNEVYFRLANVSEVNFENATYNKINFGDIKAGSKTEYKLFKNQYSYGAVSITIDGKDFGWTPIDYVGESLLEDGRYTFAYSFDISDEILTDKLIRDE